MRVVFDEPVPPKIPTVSPDAIVKSTSSRAYLFAVEEYLKRTSSKRIEPSFTSVVGFSGERISDSQFSTSAIRLPPSMDIDSMTKIMENIIRHDSI